MNDQVLEVICNHLKPVIYNESSYIIREEDPLDRMLFITQGTAWAYKNSSITDHHVNSINGDDQSFNGNSMNSSSSSHTRTRRLKRCDYFGEELLLWSLTHSTISEFPISTTNVKSHTKVEAFAFMANDLMNAGL
ncbi:hypothetical protein TIFTF001_013635 [Ficus carica]|uniref:Cyclic nucleotide-binding domain-containing protein n=1 Tax=Ficus carica TaxID=3494 RepID=A0AA88A2B4_FICCA|nr:hypothetical protein TIFTF001_013635 [Ficus carica]